ncbi:endoplasmic reticulum retention protein [Malassezia japonica]|uniref:Endoplasmic reticulum retention protein n=1 Tax=Malassezia japonica TaxID=223818 RepID=A0AAF0F1H6_9BASI|nr:endoplasmic reticulum retention protein [Malassezia japonica]WFD41043.1 endoplasmic reticulum retention protein [Malassezia japonica]
MNVFRLLGDLSHIASILILIHKITTSKSCRGISLKTQLLYVAVFVTRYLALFSPPRLYLIVMKIFFISSSLYVVYLMKVKFKSRVEVDIDTVRLDYLVGACAVLSLLFNYKFTPLEIAWSFSIFLESVAILPQMFLLQRLGEAETITTHYIFALGAYRALYIINWLTASLIFEPKHHFDYITFLAGLVQTGLYADFFYIYYEKVMHGKKFELPA